MHELVDLAKFDVAVALVGLIGLPAGLLIGAVLGRLRSRMGWYLSRGAAIGLLGPIVYGLWRYYRWTVRLDPESGYIGLHKPSVLFLNVVFFAVFGAILGVIYGRILRRSSESCDRG